MKNWEKHSDYLETGDFHVHTSYTEGSNSVDEMCQQAMQNNLKLICFAEHVRKQISYDYDALLADIERAREKYPGLVILSGCEAKVLDTKGSLDVSEEILEKAEIVVASFHGFSYGSKHEYMSAVLGMLRNPRVDIWGHPATFLRNADLAPEEKRKIIETCISNWVIIEDSLAEPYRTHQTFTDIARGMGATVVQSSDAHSKEELKLITV